MRTKVRKYAFTRIGNSKIIHFIEKTYILFLLLKIIVIVLHVFEAFSYLPILILFSSQTVENSFNPYSRTRIKINRNEFVRET